MHPWHAVVRGLCQVRWAVIVAVSLALGGCGQKEPPPRALELSPHPVSAASEAPKPVDTAPAPPPEDGQATPVPVASESPAEDNSLRAAPIPKYPDLGTMNKIFKSYCATLDPGRKPKGLGELVAAGYFDKVPSAPPGNHFAIDFKKMEIVIEKD